MKLLVQAGADVSRENNKAWFERHSQEHGHTVLYISTTYRHLTVMEYPIQYGASVSYREALPSTVSLLLKAGADISTQAWCGGIPLHYPA